jgi:hypothetical protein
MKVTRHRTGFATRFELSNTNPGLSANRELSRNASAKRASRKSAGLVLRSLSAVSEAPPSEELGVETPCRGRFRYSNLKEAAPWDYGICIWMSRC